MKHTLKLTLAAALAAITLCACNKVETPEAEVKEEILVYTSVSDYKSSVGAPFMATAVGEGYFTVIDEDFSLGLIDADGNTVLPYEYITAHKIRDGVMVIRGEDGWGYYNVDSRKFILDCKYDEVLDFSEGIGCYFDGEVYRYIDTDGKPLFDGKIIEGTSFSDGLARVMTDDSLGYIGKDGKIALYCDYEYFDDFREGYARVAQGDELGFMKKNGELLTVVDCERLYNFSNGYAQFVKNGKVCLLGSDGKVALRTEYDALSRKQTDEYFALRDGVLPVMKDGKYGFIDAEGNEVIAPQYALAMYPCEGIIRVRGENKLYGYVKTDGTVLVECKFDTATEFSGGTATVSEGGRYYFINAEGEALGDERYLDATAFSGDFALVYKDGADCWSVVRRA